MKPIDRQRERQLTSDLEQHLRGLRATENRIREMRLQSQLGRVGADTRAIHPMHDEEYGRHSFAMAAMKLGFRLNTQQHLDEKMYTDILATVPSAIDSLAIVDQDDRTEDSNSARLRLAEFNGVLRTIIDTHPHIQPETVVTLMKSAALRYGYGSEDINLIGHKTDQRLRAMKHELAHMSALYRLPYDIEETGARDDRNGIDARVGMPNGVKVTIDVKASEGSAERGREKAAEYYRANGIIPPKNKLIVFSGFTEADFTPENPWRPTEEAIERVLPHIEARLLEAAGMDGITSSEKVG